MDTVILSLVPAALVSLWFFGVDALAVILVTVAATLGAEVAMLRALGQGWADAVRQTRDGSATVTAVLLALTMPPASPWWLCVIGGVVAMTLGKHFFGGIGSNPFNPAILARVFLLISFPTQMITFSPTVESFGQTSESRVESFKAKLQAQGVDGASYATPLSRLKEASRLDREALAKEQSVIGQEWPLWRLLIGNIGGSIGEVSVIALLLGAALLFYLGYISWHIPLSFVATTGAITAAAWLYDPIAYANPIFHILSGGLIIGAFFMATDMVTSPVSPKGMLLFGAGCGLITAVIRLWGVYPEGASFAILIMNGLVPLIDSYTRPTKFGAV